MRTVTGFGALIAAVLVLVPLTGAAQGHGQGSGQERGGDHARERAQVERTHSDFDRDRMHDRDQARQHSQDRDRMHDPAHAQPEDRPIYGQQMMSVEERNQYREQLRVLGEDTEEGTRFQAQHREQMQVRAKEQGVNLDDTPETD